MIAVMVVVLASIASIIAIVATFGSVSAATLMLGIVAAVTILALGGMGAAWAVRFRRSANQRATRVTNLERRVTALADRLSKHATAMEQESALPHESLERQVQQLETKVAEFERVARERGAASTRSLLDMTASLVALGRAEGLRLSDFVQPQQAAEQVRAAAGSGRILEALPFLNAFPEVLRDLDLTTARALIKGLRRLGYLSHAVAVIEEIAERFGNPGDARAAEMYASELRLYRGEVDLDLELPAMNAECRSDVVLHFVGKAMPETQSGYTLRTQYTVEAQRQLGLEPVVVAQAGASDRVHRYTETYEHRGIRYYLLGGPKRGSVPWDQWLRENVIALAEVVRLARPAVIHAHSDFMNAMIALPVARAYGIPLVNETRGFWEESWLSRTATAEGWGDLNDLRDRYGLPDMYSLRVEREAQARSESDAVITLARVMRDHIDHIGADRGFPAPTISIAPNAVRTADFPVLPRDGALRERLGFATDGVVIGYISSIVEYEGIDTLVRGMFELESAIDAVRQLELHRSESTLSTGPRGPSVGSNAVGGEAEAPQNGWRDHDIGVTTVADSVGPQAEASGVGAVASTSLGSAVLDGLVEKLRTVHQNAGDDALRAYGEALIASVDSFRDKPIDLLIVGDGAELPTLKKLAGDLGVKNVRFAGRVPHDQVLDYYGVIDVFVVPRKRAAVTDLVTPLKPFEAMSTGKPCVFSDVRALAEIAEDSGAVELFKAGDHHDLAKKIAALLGDPDRMNRMARAGAEWVRKERTWDRNARDYASVYRALGVGTAGFYDNSAEPDAPG